MKTSRLLWIGMAALAFAACDNEENLTDPLADGPVAMSFTADISSVATRATATGFEAGDKVGIIPMRDGNVETSQANIAYTYGDDNKFTANPPYWFQKRGEVTFNAYYPYDENLANDNDYVFTIETGGNQTTEKINGNDWLKNDYLFASAKTDVNYPEISFTEAGGNPFKHVMSSIVFKFSAGTDAGVANLNALSSYFIARLAVVGTFDCKTGIVATDPAPASQGTIGGIDLSDKVSGLEYTADPLIVLPQTLSYLKLNVVYNGTTYVAELNLDELKAGTRYEIPVTIKNTGLVIGNAEIEDWIAETPTGGDATLQ